MRKPGLPSKTLSQKQKWLLNNKIKNKKGRSPKQKSKQANLQANQ